MAGIVCCEIAVKHKIAGVVSVGPICPGPETKEAFEHRVEVVKKGQFCSLFPPCRLPPETQLDMPPVPAFMPRLARARGPLLIAALLRDHQRWTTRG